MRLYDVDIIIHLSCPAHSKDEAEDACLKRFREGEYNYDEVEMQSRELK